MLLEMTKGIYRCKGITVAAFERSVGMSNASFGKSLKKKGALALTK